MPASGGRARQPVHRPRLGGAASARRFFEGDVGDQALVRPHHREHGVDAIIHFAGSVVVPDSVADPLGYYLNNTVKSRALIEVAVKAASATSSSPRPPPSTACRRPAGRRGRAARAHVALRLVQAHDRDRCWPTRRRRTTSAMWRCATSTSPAPTRRAAPASRPRAPPISSRSPARRRSASAAICRCSAPTIRPPTAPACATTSTSPTSRVPTWRRLRHLRAGGGSDIFNAATAADSRCWR